MPNQDVLDAKVDAEIARLRQVIAVAEAGISDLQNFKALLKKQALAPIIGESGLAPLAASADAAVAVVAKKAGRQLYKKDQILDAAENVLADGVRRLSRDLLPEIEKQGVKIGGKDAVNALAVYLSREKHRFQTDQRAGGWTLTRFVQKRKPDDVGASSGFFVPTCASQHPSAG